MARAGTRPGDRIRLDFPPDSSSIETLGLAMSLFGESESAVALFENVIEFSPDDSALERASRNLSRGRAGLQARARRQ